jgi:hypothetical protein
MWADSMLILLISVFTALLGEGLTWLLVYRTDKYQVCLSTATPDHYKKRLLVEGRPI